MLYQFCAVAILLVLWSSEVARAQSGDEGEKLEQLIATPQYEGCSLDMKAKCDPKKKDLSLLIEPWMTQDCKLCTCFDDLGVLCCSMLTKPTDWPDHCFPMVDLRHCKVELRLKSNPRLSCTHRRTSHKHRNHHLKALNSHRRRVMIIPM